MRTGAPPDQVGQVLAVNSGLAKKHTLPQRGRPRAPQPEIVSTRTSNELHLLSNFSQSLSRSRERLQMGLLGRGKSKRFEQDRHSLF